MKNTPQQMIDFESIKKDGKSLSSCPPAIQLRAIVVYLARIADMFLDDGCKPWVISQAFDAISKDLEVFKWQKQKTYSMIERKKED